MKYYIEVISKFSGFKSYIEVVEDFFMYDKLVNELNIGDYIYFKKILDKDCFLTKNHANIVFDCLSKNNKFAKTHNCLYKQLSDEEFLIMDIVK